MGIVKNQTVRGQLSFSDDGVFLKGINSKGIPTKVRFIGNYVDGKTLPIEKDTFIKDLKKLIVMSSNMAMKNASPKQQQELKKQLKKRLEGISGNGEIQLQIEEASGVYDTKAKEFLMTARGLAVVTSNNRDFHNVKPVENTKGGKNYIPSTIKVFGMVMKRDEFNSLSKEEQKNIKYSKTNDDAHNWVWKELSVSDVERGNIDFLTVKYKATLNKVMSSKNDIKTIITMESTYIKYMEQFNDKKFKNPLTLLADENKEKYVFPKLSIYIPDYLLIEKAGYEDLKDMLKGFFENVNKNLDNEYFILLKSEDGSREVRVDANTIDSIKDERILQKTYKGILEQLNFMQEGFLKMATKKDIDENFMQFVRACDNIHSSNNKTAYIKSLRNMLKIINENNLISSPISISYDLSTNGFEAKTNPQLATNLKEANRNMLKEIAGDITRPIESIAIKINFSKSESDYVNSLKNSFGKYINIDREHKKISYQKNENGFTLKDKMFLSVNGRVEKPLPFQNQNGETITPKVFKAIYASKKPDTQPFIGIAGQGGRRFEHTKQLSILSELGMSYIKQPFVPLNVSKDNTPKLSINPLTGEIGKIKIAEPTKPTASTPTPPKQTEPTVSTPTPPKQVEPIVQTSLFEATDNDIVDAKTEETRIDESEVKVANKDDIDKELDMLGGFSLDDAELEEFLGNDESVNIQVANEVRQSGVSDIAPA